VPNINRVWSPPKAGRTWLRAAFGKLEAIQQGKPDSDAKQLSSHVAKFGHRIRDVDTVKHNNLFLVRDPRDLLVSEYFHTLYRGYHGLEFKGTISEYLRLEWSPTDRLLNTYDQYWELLDVCKSGLMVQYEDLHRNLRGQLVGIFDFFGVEYLEEELDEVVEWSSFHNLHYLSSIGHFASGFFNPTDPANPESFKFRKGLVGGYKDYLTDEDVEYINNICTKRGYIYE
jgi:hypothetical protein